MTDEEKAAAAELAAANSNDATEINDDDLLAAVSAAVDEQTIKPETDDDADDNDDDADDNDDDADADDNGDKDDEAEDDETDADDATPDPDKDPESDDDSDDDSGDGSADPDGKKGNDKTGSDDDAADTDPVNDPIPEATNEKTATRIKSLITLVKSKGDSEAQRDEIVDQITATGADPEQYANTLGFLRLYNSKDIKDRKVALEVVRGMVKELALDVGEGASVTKLEDHEDLQAEVEAGTLTQARALEIAANRERQTMTDARTTANNAATETANQTQQNIATGKGQLDTLETALRTTHKDYETIRPMFVGILKSVLKRTHPTEWGMAAREVFDQVRAANPEAAAPKPKSKPKNTPLRPGSGTGGGADKSEDKDTALGAIEHALENM